MTTEPVLDEAAVINRAVSELGPQLRRARVRALLWTGVVAILTLVVMVLVWPINDTGWIYSLIALVTGGIVISMIVALARRQHEVALMPILARSAGLTHRKGDNSFHAGLPRGSLPRGSVEVDDVLSGQVGGRTFSFGEVKIETGGEDSKTLFKGLVTNYHLLVPMPDFILADEGTTRGVFGLGLGQTIKTDGLQKHEVLTSPQGHEFGLWSSWPLGNDQKRVVSLAKGLFRVADELEGGKALFSVQVSGGILSIAVRHKPNLYTIGGVFSGKAALTEDLRRAVRELGLPMQILTHILEAESMMAASDRTGQPAPDQVPDRQDHREVEE